MFNQSDAPESSAIEVPFGDHRPDHWPSYREDSVFWSAVVEAEEQIQVPLEMAMMSALGAISTACQSQINVELPTRHRVQTPLMLLTLAESGERKTTVQDKFFESIVRLNREAITVGKKRLETYESQLLLWEVEEKALKNKLTKAIKSDDQQAAKDARKQLQDHQIKAPIFPILPRFLYDDTTPGALVQYLHDHSPNGCILTSEANSIFSGRALQELDKLNTLWDGGDVIVDRLTRPSFILSGARLTLSLMTQPSVIDRFLSKRGEEARGMGFLARFLVVKPRKMAGDRITKQISALPHVEKFNERIEAILSDPESGPLFSDNTEKQVMTFTADAASLWNKYDQGVEQAMKNGQPYAYYTDHASKLMDNVSRMAALLHFFEGHQGPISKETLTFCYDFVRKCSTHFQRHLAGEPKVVTEANKLAKFFLGVADKEEQGVYNFVQGIPDHLATGRQVSFTLTFIKQKGPYTLRGRENDEQLREAIELLKRMGHIQYKVASRSYVFRENIFSNESGPELRNGIEYQIEALPYFNQQEFFNSPRHNFLNQKSGFYLIRPEHLSVFDSLVER